MHELLHPSSFWDILNMFGFLLMAGFAFGGGFTLASNLVKRLIP
jgi:hypothetical protein